MFILASSTLEILYMPAKLSGYKFTLRAGWLVGCLLVTRKMGGGLLVKNAVVVGVEAFKNGLDIEHEQFVPHMEPKVEIFLPITQPA